MKNKVRVIILLAIFGLSLTAIPSCDKQEDQSIEQVVKKSGEGEMTRQEWIEHIGIVQEFESHNSCAEGLTSSGSYLVVSMNEEYAKTPPDYFIGEESPGLCCYNVVICDGVPLHTCCWAYNCDYCSCYAGAPMVSFCD